MKKNTNNIRTILLVAILLMAVPASAQSDKIVSIKYENWKNQNLYIFPDFTTGIVYFTNRAPGSAMVNYNRVASSVQFIDDQKTPYNFANTKNIVAITVGKHEFLPVNDKFVEVLERRDGNYLLAVMWSIKILDVKKQVAYGGTSSVSASQVMNAFATSNLNVISKLRDSDEIVLTYKNIYFFGVNGKLYEFNKKNILKQFSNVKLQIDSYLAENKVQFHIEDDVKKMFNYCLSVK